jgi:hypothetical protein
MGAGCIGREAAEAAVGPSRLRSRAREALLEGGAYPLASAAAIYKSRFPGLPATAGRTGWRCECSTSARVPPCSSGRPSTMPYLFDSGPEGCSLR